MFMFHYSSPLAFTNTYTLFNLRVYNFYTYTIYSKPSDFATFYYMIVTTLVDYALVFSRRRKDKTKKRFERTREQRNTGPGG